MKKDKVCPEIRIKDSSYTVPLPPQHASLEITKPATPIYSDSGVFDSSGDSMGVYPPLESHKPKYYNELIDTIIVFKNDSLKTADSLDFVADINFDMETKTFDNTFDFVLRPTKEVVEIEKEVFVPMKPEIWQNGFVIVLGLVTAFLFGLVF